MSGRLGWLSMGLGNSVPCYWGLWLSVSARMCIISLLIHTWHMRTNIEIDDVLMREAQKASGHATKKQTVEEALRLMIRLRRQHEVDAAFGKYRWRGNLARSRTGRGAR